MTATEIRCKARTDHARLRRRLVRLERAATRTLRSHGPAAEQALARHLETLRRELGGHLAWEARHVPEALRDADAWGEARVAWLRARHRELWDLLALCQHGCGEGSHPLVRARRARDLTALLRGVLAEEERAAYRPEVLREDVVAIDQVSG